MSCAVGAAAAHRIEQPVSHQAGNDAALIERKHFANRHIDAEFGREALAGLLDAQDCAVGPKAEKSRADVERRDVGHLAVRAHRDLRGSAADVDVHHRAFVANRARHRAGAVGRHDCFEAVAGADRHHLPGLPREQFADRARVSAAHRDAGEDQRAGIDLVRIDLGVGVLFLDEGAERFGVDGFALGVGRQQNVRAVECLALAHHIAAVEPLQHDAREHQMRGR